MEWRKQYKELYLPKQSPILIELEPMQYITVSGEGSPDSKTFQNCVEALYALSYAIKMAPRKGIQIEGYEEYTVFPLEGVWNLNEEGKQRYTRGVSSNDLREYFIFTLMIRQPDFVTPELFRELQKMTYQKKKSESILQANFQITHEPLSCQMMHIGPYKDEPESFRMMEEYVLQQGYQRSAKYHKEIYISDPRKVSPDKMKTVLRFEIKKTTN